MHDLLFCSDSPSLLLLLWRGTIRTDTGAKSPFHGVAPDTKLSAHVRCALSRTHLEDAPHCPSQLVAYGRAVAYVDISPEPRVLVTISGWDDSREFDK